MSTIALFAAAGLITFGLRTGLVIGGAARPLPDRFQSAIGFIPPAVLAAIVAGGLFVTDHRVEMPRLAELAAIAAGVVAVRRYDNVGFALLVGLPTYWLASALGL